MRAQAPVPRYPDIPRNPLETVLEEKMADEEEKVEEGAAAEGSAEAAAPEEKPEDKGPTLTAKEIEKMNVPKLKEAALAYGGRISGVHGMDKGQLVRALKEINGIPLQEPRRASKVDRSAVKQKIRALKKERDQKLDEKARVELRRVRKRIKGLRRKLVRSS